MCIDCERDEMLAAYRDYVAARRRAPPAATAPASGTEMAPAARADADWAAGTWFAALETAAAGRRE